MGAAPTTGSSAARGSLAEWASGWVFFLELEVLRRLPLTWVMRWLRVLGWLRWELSPSLRRGTRSRMASFAPDSAAQAEELAREHLTHKIIGRRLKYLIFTRDADDYREAIELVGFEHVEKARAAGRGVVLLGNHLGLPQILRWYLRTTELSVLYLTAIGFPRPKTPVKRWFWTRLRARHRVDADALLGSESQAVQFLKKAHDHLRSGGLIFIAVDGQQGERSIPVTIRNRVIQLRLGGLSLGLTSGAVMLPCFSTFDRMGHFRIEIQEALEVPEESSRADQIAGLAEEFGARLEAEILAHPTSVPERLYLGGPKI